MKKDYLVKNENTQKAEEILDVEDIIETEELLYAISKAIINYRKEMNLTQKELAEQLSMNQTMISKLESGNYNPTFRIIYKISKKLTNSHDFFIQILDDIKMRLMSVYNYKVKLNYENSYIENNLEEKDIKIISLFQYNSTSIKGGYNNGKRTSRISNVG